MARIIAANSNSYHGFSIEEAIKGIHAAGFRYIELTATKGWTEHVFPDQTFERLLEIRNLLKTYRLSPIGMSGHCNLMDKDRIGDFEKNIEMAAFFGCTYIVSSIGEAHLENKADLDHQAVADQIATLIPTLEKHDLQLVLEVHGADHGSGVIVDEIVKRIDHNRVKINYDTANALFYGDVSLVDDLNACMDNVAYMHLKEKAGGRTEWNFPALGEGWIDFPSIFKALEKAKNDCPFSIEIEFTQDGAKDVHEVDEAMLKSAQYLQSQGFEL